jgi:hypothetical protein
MRFTVFIAEDTLTNLEEITKDVELACLELTPPLRRDIDYVIESARTRKDAEDWVNARKSEPLLYIFDLYAMNNVVDDFDLIVKARLTQQDTNPLIVITRYKSTAIIDLLRKARSPQRYTEFIDRVTGTVMSYREQMRAAVTKSVLTLIARV